MQIAEYPKPRQRPHILSEVLPSARARRVTPQESIPFKTVLTPRGFPGRMLRRVRAALAGCPIAGSMRRGGLHEHARKKFLGNDGNGKTKSPDFTPDDFRRKCDAFATADEKGSCGATSFSFERTIFVDHF